MALNDESNKEQISGQENDSRHSSLSLGSSSVNSLNNSINNNKSFEKDELAISQRGKLPTKGSNNNNNMQSPSTTQPTTISIEDHLNLLTAEEEKSWKYQDSVHSGHHAFGAQYFDNHKNGGASESSLAFDDSCASFDTFGGAGDDIGTLSESASDLLADQKAAFCNLEPEMTPRRKILSARTPSSRLIRAPSARASNLQLIGEEDDL